MISYKKIIILLFVTSFLNATNLKEIIQSTLNNNENIKALGTLESSKKQSYESVKNIYNPNIIIGANYSQLDLDTRAVQVGQTTTAFVKLGLNLYDGGKNKAIKQQKNYEFQSSKLNNNITKKETILQVVTLFFKTKTVIENIKVFEEKAITLKAQYNRVKTKYNIQMATMDEVLKLQSEYETNQYTIEDLKYQKSELLNNLSLLSGINITSIDNSNLPNISNLKFQTSENIKALELSIKAQEENEKIASSINKPQLKLENSLNFYNYDDYNERLLTDLPDKQNQFSLQLTYNLYDTSSKYKILSLKLSKIASRQKLNFLKKQEKINFELAKRKLNTQKHKIQSLKSAVKMGNSVYDTIKTKYQNGLVDNITYLDALSKKIYNFALYKQALNDYEIAKANYYFRSGINYNKILEMSF